MRIVFLDIDGVLNSSKNYQAYSKAQTEDPDTNAHLRGRIDHLHRHVELLFDKENVAMLNSITYPADAKIVVSSSWRRLYSGTGKPDDDRLVFSDLTALLARVGVTAPVIDRTPCHLTTKMSQQTSRGTEIQAWLDENRKVREVTQYVILDDDNDMDHLFRFHIWTDPSLGLTREDSEEALRVLEGTGYVPTRHRARSLRSGGA